MSDENHDLVVVTSQSKVPKLSLFEATPDAESAVEAFMEAPAPNPTVLKQSAGDSDSSTEPEDSLFDDTDIDSNTADVGVDDHLVVSRTSRRNYCCSRRCLLLCLAVIVYTMAVVGVTIGVLYEFTCLFKDHAVAPTTPTTVDTPAPPTPAPPTPTQAPTLSSMPNDPLYEALKSFSLGGLDDQTSPQFQAYEWLLNDDPLVNSESDPLLIQQRYALATLYASMGIEMPLYATQDECDWPTVECGITNVTDIFDTEELLFELTNEGTQVTEINMTGASLEGTIPPEIGLLPSLVRLDLSENPGLHGSIPEELYQLYQLTYLYLNNNDMTGTLSESISNLQLLEELFLGSNSFTGTIPVNLGSPQGVRPLRYLNLFDNEFEGTIPLGLNLRSAFYIDLSYNNLSGTLPNDIGSNFEKLKQLYLDHNRLTGTIPESFSKISFGRIYVLTLNDNKLVGGVPTGWLSDNQFLDTLNVQGNELTEPIEGIICSLSAVKYGELVELGADCEICTCDDLCTKCY